MIRQDGLSDPPVFSYYRASSTTARAAGGQPLQPFERIGVTQLNHPWSVILVADSQKKSGDASS
jgi:hypothetical protein